ncbi:MAG TPA: tyrosine-type recombinase/integrase [Rudaea sp.]|nr:tyrosine-type recombinase/integrase [Rudaea sp.]
MPRDLPPRLHRKHGAYYYVRGHVWTHLGRDYGQALRTWAEWEGREAAPIRTIAQALAQYIADSADRLQPSTITSYRDAMKQLVPVFGRMPLEALRRDHVYEYVRRRGNVSGNRERALLSAVYTWALNAGIYAGANPAAGLRYRNTERPRQRYVTDVELAALITAAWPRWKPFLRFAYLTGLRQGDLLRLRLSDASEAGITVRTGKTGKTILIGWSDELRVLWGDMARSRIGAAPLLINRDGEAYTSSGFRASWRKLKLRAGIGDVHFHDLRKKTGSDADSLTHAAQLLAHEDEGTTRKHYRVKPEAIRPIG